jgi:hypothetical protein
LLPELPADLPAIALEAGRQRPIILSPIILKWHQLRRRREDPGFSRANLAAGLAAGAVVEVADQITTDDPERLSQLWRRRSGC